MKRTFSLLLALVMVLSLAACGGKDAPADDANTPDTPAENNQPDEPDNEPAQPEDSYYPITITTYDYEGNEIETTYEKAPEKVLCVYQGTIETMIALGLEDHVTASYGLDNPVKEEWEAGLAKMNYLTRRRSS